MSAKIGFKRIPLSTSFGLWKPRAISALVPSWAAGRPGEAMHASHPAPGSTPGGLTRRLVCGRRNMQKQHTHGLVLSRHPAAFRSASHPGLALTAREGCALSDLDHVTVSIADLAANLAVLFVRLRDELGSWTFP